MVDFLSNSISKNILFSAIAKLLVVGIGLVSMPIALDYLNTVQFGIYSTITSMVAWVEMLDIGLGQGLRNKLTESFSKGDATASRKYISTSYALMIALSLFLFLLFLPFYFLLNWNRVLNVSFISSSELNYTLLVVFAFFVLRFVSSLINKVFFALQVSSLVDLTQLLGKFLFLIVLLFLVYFSQTSLFLFASVQSFISFFTPFVAGVIFYNFFFREFKPQLKYVDFRLSKELFGLGGKFFFIQICLVVIHSTNNFLISSFVGPEKVTTYQLAYQLLIYFNVAFSLINTPLWSAYTKAWALNNHTWIRKTIKRLIIMFVIFCFLALFFVLLSPLIYRFWIGDRVLVPTSLVILVALMILLNIWTSIFDFFINGVGKLRLQMYVAAIAAIVNIPLSYLFSVYFDLGTNGIVLASIISFSFSAILSPIQAFKLLNMSASGIWNK